MGSDSKVRKPYTITKQRERWSEAEHLRFVEALKLYGRSWRQIEEHVATKTAIQIRSHAQKFFAKVTRDSGVCRGEWSLNPDDIPPPRPKKKPVHPYPRKRSSSSAKEVENVSFLDGDDNKYSPSSVLSPLASSDNLDVDKNSPNTDDLFARIPSPDDKFATVIIIIHY
ncbi:hypothetical protein M569_15103 [Genlisea aurea]|uniref:Uncharacterized protein n=1 Tax=Genlisea aurea TaxID=192259 RepID=S8C5I1_9LAMI|nr:hypothetical protein M569_15103 [Genlisea aurea]